MKNTGLEYEVLVQSIFQEIHNQESAKNIIVERDVKLTGKSGIIHQIDVFWEFEIGGVRYLTIVQAKDWNSSVKQEQVLTFNSVLNDLPKQPRGIIVTRKGFQKGAKKFAESHGIELYELKEEVSKSLQISFNFGSLLFLPLGSFLNFEVNLDEQCLDSIIYAVKSSDVKLQLHNGWIKRKSKQLGNEIVYDALERLPSLNQPFFDTKYQPIEPMGEIIQGIIQSIQEEAKLRLKDIEVFQKKLSHSFNSPTYFSTKSRYLPYIRIEGINLNVEISKKESYQIPFVKTDITTFILRNIIDGKEKKFDGKIFDKS